MRGKVLRERSCSFRSGSSRDGGVADNCPHLAYLRANARPEFPVPTTTNLQQIFLLKDLSADALALVERAATSLVVEGGVEIFRANPPTGSTSSARAASA
jgi:hypothetical protein